MRSTRGALQSKTPVWLKGKINVGVLDDGGCLLGDLNIAATMICVLKGIKVKDFTQVLHQ
jgi:hypothetical protein